MVYNKLTFDEIKRRVKFINPNMVVLNETEPKGDKDDPYICHCNKCGGTFNATKFVISTAYRKFKDERRKFNWCPVCNGKKCIKGLNDVSTVRPDLVQYFVNPIEATKYTTGSNKEILFKCPCCGNAKELKLRDISQKGFNCEYCSDHISYPNKVCRALLSQLPVDEYTFEFNDKWTKKKRYDAYFKFNEGKYLLEFDGDQHFRDCRWTTKDFQESNDLFKNQLAKNNGYEIIRIECRVSDFEYIKNNIFQSELSNLFDLDKVDWDKCYKDSLTNFVQEIIKYYNDNDNPSTEKVGEAFHISAKTVRIYLKQAAKANLCDYSYENSMKRRIEKYKKTRQDRSKNVFNMFSSENELIGTFYTPEECADYLDKNMKDNIFSTGKIERCLNMGVDYLGYRFIYVDGLANHYKDNKMFFDVCNYFHENPNVTQTDTAKYFKLASYTVSIYLHAGVNSGLFDFDLLSDINNRRSLSGGNIAKREIHIYKDNEKISTNYDFSTCIKSIKALYPDSEITRAGLYQVYKIKVKTTNEFDYKGFHFEINNKKEAA